MKWTWLACCSWLLWTSVAAGRPAARRTNTPTQTPTLELPTAILDRDAARRANRRSLRVMFWNVENLFDTEDNPLTADNDFLPTGSRRWTPRRYHEKLQHLARALVEVGAWGAPTPDTGAAWHPADIIGLAEVENEGVLQDLLQQTPLGALGYVPLLTHSADVRGIQVGMLYRPATFHIVGQEAWHIALPKGKRETRHLLHVWGTPQADPHDTLDFVVCHLPSRYGGVVASAPSRQAAHRCLAQHVDSLEACRTALRLLVMGDMNDYPDTPLLRDDLQLREPPLAARSRPKSGRQPRRYRLYPARIFPSARYNLMLTLTAQKKPIAVMGSHKYQGEWGFLDQFFATGRLLAQVQAWGVFALPDMLTADRTHSGVRPRRSYYGYGYEGGYSDHLPIVISVSVPDR